MLFNHRDGYWAFGHARSIDEIFAIFSVWKGETLYRRRRDCLNRVTFLQTRTPPLSPASSLPPSPSPLRPVDTGRIDFSSFLADNSKVLLRIDLEFTFVCGFCIHDSWNLNCGCAFDRCFAPWARVYESLCIKLWKLSVFFLITYHDSTHLSPPFLHCKFVDII